MDIKSQYEFKGYIRSNSSNSSIDVLILNPFFLEFQAWKFEFFLGNFLVEKQVNNY